MHIGGVEFEDELGWKFRRADGTGWIDALDLTNSRHRFLRGLHFTAKGNYTEAVREFEFCEKELPLESAVQRWLLHVSRHQELEAAITFVESHCENPALHAHLRGCMWHVRGLAEGRLRRTAQAAGSLLEAIRLFREAEDAWSTAHVRDTLGTLEAARGRLEQAMQCYAMALVDKSLLGDRLGMAVTLGNLGRVHLRTGRFRDAIECFERDLSLCDELGDQRGRCRMHNDLGRTSLAAGDWLRSEEELQAGAELAENLGFPDIAFYCRKDLVLLRTQQRKFELADRELAAAQRHLSVVGAPYLEILWQEARGELLIARQDPQGIRVLQDVVEAFHAQDLPDSEIPARVALARGLIQDKQVYAAERVLLAGMRLAQVNGFARYFSPLNEALTQLDLSIGVDLEVDKRWTTTGATEGAGSEKLSHATGAYILRGSLGSGGFGQVYRAYDSNRGMEVALKVIPLGTEYDSKLRAALVNSTRTELAAASRVRHPGVVRVHAVGQNPDGHLYICQELVEGHSLRARMEASAFELSDNSMTIVLGIVYALEALHDAHVFHRDLKPQNILVRNSDQPVLIDFGIAQLRPASWFDKPDISGTVEYMAPEQAAGKSVDGRADLYSLGVILYEWLCGRRPLRLAGENWHARVLELQRQTPKPITIFRPDIPPRLANLVHQLLDKRPRRRPSSARMVADVLKGLQI